MWDVHRSRAGAACRYNQWPWFRAVNKMLRSRFNPCCLMAALVAIVFLSGCESRPENAYTVAQPQTRPVRNIGNFNEALRCMDDLFIRQAKQDIYITTAGIPDATGLISAGTKDMFITAVSRMSARSHAFRFVDYDPTQLDVQVLSELVGLRNNFRAPNYYVRGAITQLDSNVLQSSAGGGVSVPNLDLALNASQVVSVVSIDMNVGELVTRQIIPGISASNSIAVVQSGKGVDAAGLIGKAGLSLSVSLDKSEGFHQAVRNLIELSTIEVLGKLTKVPYWQCLSIPSTNPTYQAEARSWFDVMPSSERDQFVRTALAEAGYEAGGSSLTEAIGRYQADNDLVPTGRIDFDLYYRLLASDAYRPAGRRVAAAATVTTSQPAAPTPAPTAQPLRLLVSTARGPAPTYRAGETMVVSVQPSEDAYVACYYQDSAGNIVRVFPNRFQPQGYVPANRLIEIPPPGQKSFAIRFDRPGGRETVACLAAERGVGLRLPPQLNSEDLTPLPVTSLDQIASQIRSISGGRVTDARLTAEIAQ